MKNTRKHIFIGVAWPYVNGDLHIGHLAGYLLPADIFARFHRYKKNNVLMVSGSDCYGTPITIAADKEGKTPEQIVDEHHPKNLRLFKNAGISFDLYTKTTTDLHKEIAQNIFLELLKHEIITPGKDEGYFSKEESRFLPDRYVEGICPHCDFKDARSDQCENCGKLLSQGELKNPKSKLSGSTLELKETEHYFLDWKKLEPFLKSFVKERGNTWRTWVRKETEGWLKQGLKPRAITRDLDWGVELPVDRIPENLRIKNINEKRIYVWFEAVAGYLSASEEWAEAQSKKDAFNNFWHNNNAEHYYFLGKDNLVFHALFWPGQLHAYNKKLHLPDVVAVNNFLNLEGHKFSKSRGVIIDSAEFIERYGKDPLRFYLATILPENADANFSWNEFVSKHNSVLIGNLGNFINRTLTLAKDADLHEKHTKRKVRSKAKQTLEQAEKALENVKIKDYVEIVLKLADFGNKYFSKAEPWKGRQHRKFLSSIMSDCTYLVLTLQALIKPLLPDAYEKLADITGIEFDTWPNEKDIKTALQHVKIKELHPLFQKIEPSIVEKERKKLSIDE